MMLALAAHPPRSGKRLGRPAAESPRNCIAYARLTSAEYEALLGLMPARGSLSDLIRELLSEAVWLRLMPPAVPSRNFNSAGKIGAVPAGLLNSRQQKVRK